MEDIDSSPLVANPLKRPAPLDETSPSKKPLNLKGTQFIMPTPPDTDQSSNASPTGTYNAAARDASPAPSNSTLTSIDVASSLPGQGSISAGATQPTSSGTSGPPSAKRRKLTLEEKQQQQQEKDAKVAERAEQKVRRDEEKRIKDEERRAKAEVREAKKREKEVEEEKKAEAKMKKERSQMRLGAFFQKPAGSAQADRATILTRRKSLSLEPFDALAEQIRASQSPSRASQKAQALTKSDYYEHFKPFHLPTNSSLPAPDPRSVEEMEALQEAFDREIDGHPAGLNTSIGQIFFRERGSRGFYQPDMRELVDQIQGSYTQPIDLTNDRAIATPMDVLQSISRRQIQFEEDVRPAYYGTYSKIRSPRACAKMRRNPFTRGRQDTEYDYDSEAEWQEEEEGEDLAEEDDDEAESVAEAGEMDEFLDDEDDALKVKRKMITGDLVPTCTGLRWENERGKIMPSIEDNSANDMHGMRLGFLLQGFTGKTIDPFCTAYWEEEPTMIAPQPTTLPSTMTSAPLRESPFTPARNLMAPPRPPLHPRLSGNGSPDPSSGLIGAHEGMKGPITSVSVQEKARRGPKPSPRTLSSEDLEEFKEAVVGSPLSKADLLKGLKSRFPKITNETIKTSLGEYFAQVGASKADKKWVFVPKMA